MKRSLYVSRKSYHAEQRTHRIDWKDITFLLVGFFCLHHPGRGLLLISSSIWLASTWYYSGKGFTLINIQCACLCLQVGELGRLSASMKKLEKELKNTNKYKVCFWDAFVKLIWQFQVWILVVDILFVFHFFLVASPLQNEQYRSKHQKSNERSLALVKSAIDIVVAVGLLQLSPKKVTPRVTGAFGFTSSLISCYQVYFSLASTV